MTAFSVKHIKGTLICPGLLGPYLEGLNSTFVCLAVMSFWLPLYLQARGASGKPRALGLRWNFDVWVKLLMTLVLLTSLIALAGGRFAGGRHTEYCSPQIRRLPPGWMWCLINHPRTSWWRQSLSVYPHGVSGNKWEPFDRWLPEAMGLGFSELLKDVGC